MNVLRVSRLRAGATVSVSRMFLFQRVSLLTPCSNLLIKPGLKQNGFGFLFSGLWRHQPVRPRIWGGERRKLDQFASAERFWTNERRSSAIPLPSRTASRTRFESLMHKPPGTISLSSPALTHHVFHDSIEKIILLFAISDGVREARRRYRMARPRR